MTPAEPVVDLRDVTVAAADGTVLLADVTWQVLPGQRWAVLGGNGAGKSTLLRVVAGLAEVDDGDVHVLGEPLDHDDADALAELRSRVGLASSAVADQVPGRARVRDLVAGAALGLAADQGAGPPDDVEAARADAVLRSLGAAALADRRWATLSEGERRRVLVARAVLADPELLLLDEPAAALDLGAREALLRRLARLAADPDAPVLVLVTHVVEEIPPGTTHALLLRGGQVTAAGPAEDVLAAGPLSECFGFPLAVSAADGRWSARARVTPPRRAPVARR